jgi:hypothetical protein
MKIFIMKKNKMFMLAAALTFALVLAGCATTDSGAADGDTPGGGAPNTGLSLLLRTVPSEIQTWDEGNANERDITVYSFNPEIKDELTQAVKDAGFIEAGSGEYPRDWDLQRSCLLWCVSPDIEKWDHELQFSAKGETTVHTYGFKPGKPVSTGGGAPNTDRDLSSLLRVVPSEIQTWDEGNANERDVTVYSLNPDNSAVKDELIRAVKKEAGFIEAGSGEYSRDWDLQKGVLRWCVSPDTERWNNEIQFSAKGETTVHTLRFTSIPNSDGVPKTIKITGYSPEGGITAYAMSIFSETAGADNWPPAAVAVEEIDGQTITYPLGIWMYRWDNLEPWTGTGKFFIVIECNPLKDPSRDGSKYVYSEDGIHPAPVDITDEATTLEWSKFIWLWDYTAG